MLQFRVQLIEQLKVLLKQPEPVKKEWLKSAEVRKLLGVSHGTLQNLRINGLLPYSKVGGLIFYKYDDLVKLLEGDRKSGQGNG
ncbi:MAG: helix-turn-helix domain-containing protein [Cyclobacteriaceae bacterium]